METLGHFCYRTHLCLWVLFATDVLKTLHETSKKRDDIAIIKMNIAIKLLEAFGSKSKKASVFDDDLAKILGSLKI